MQKLIELDINPNILVSSTILKHDKPDYIYIPIINKASLLVRKNDYVSIGSPVIQDGNMIIYSTISGLVTAIKKVDTFNGIVDAIEIANDFKEKKLLETLTKRNLNRFKKEDFDKILFNNFNFNFDSKKNLILNCIDDEPYVLTENFNLFNNYDGFLDLLDKFSKIYKLSKVIIVIRSSSSENINKLMNQLGMYPNISLNIVPSLYLLGTTDFLLDYLNLNDKESIVIKASQFYNIYNLIKRNRIATDKFITISGDGLNNPSIVKVKIGSNAKDVINNLIEVKDNVIYIANSLMQGKLININNFIITSDITSILIMKDSQLKIESKCINCGACIDICPVNINPLYLSNKRYKAKIKDKCLNCGLCSYICPVYINFNKILKGDSNE